MTLERFCERAENNPTYVEAVAHEPLTRIIADKRGHGEISHIPLGHGPIGIR